MSTPCRRHVGGKLANEAEAETLARLFETLMRA